MHTAHQVTQYSYYYSYTQVLPFSPIHFSGLTYTEYTAELITTPTIIHSASCMLLWVLGRCFIANLKQGHDVKVLTDPCSLIMASAHMDKL